MTRFIRFFGPKSYFALIISARINNAQIIMTCPGFDRSWLYRELRELDKFYMQEMDINEHFLAAVLQTSQILLDFCQSTIRFY